MKLAKSLSTAMVLAAVSLSAPGVALADASGDSDSAVDMDVAARQTEWWLSGLGVSAAQGPAHGGAGVKVCLIDSGVDASHPDLKGAHFAGGKDLSGVGSPDGLKPMGGGLDVQSDHGTTMATWIVGQGHGPGHSKGVLGVAPRATLMSVSTKFDDASIGRGVRYCVDHGARVINMSTTYQPPKSVMSYALSKDVVVVSGAGNTLSDKGDPNKVSNKIGKSCNGMGGLQLGQITVGGVTSDKKIAPISCQNGDVSKSRDESTLKSPAGVSLGAPSDGAMKPDGSAFPLMIAQPRNSLGAYRVNEGGTSTSAALTSGVVALVRAAHPELKAGDVINRLIRTATPVSGGGASGPKGPMGFGIINAKAAVSADVPSVGGANPLGDPATGDGGVWTNPSWKGSSSSASGGSTQAGGAFSGQGSSGGSVGTLVWVVGGVAALGVVVIGGVVAVSRRRRS